MQNLEENFQQYLSDKQLLAYARSIGRPLPFSRSSLQKDRGNGPERGCLGGVPYHPLGGKVIYIPHDVFGFMDGLPVIQPKRNTVVALKKQGTSSKSERVEAAARGISVRELRQLKGVCNG